MIKRIINLLLKVALTVGGLKYVLRFVPVDTEIIVNGVKGLVVELDYQYHSYIFVDSPDFREDGELLFLFFSQIDSISIC